MRERALRIIMYFRSSEIYDYLHFISQYTLFFG